MGKEATETNVKSATTAEADLIIFSTHAVLSGEIEGLHESGIFLSNPKEKDVFDDGFLSVSEVFDIKFKSNPIIVLSACDTAGPDYQRGETYSGLASSFLRAGASTVLASHWPVETNSTKLLISETIKRAKYTKSDLSKSLQEVQIAMSKGDFGKEFSHPYFWAPFVTVSLN